MAESSIETKRRLLESAKKEFLEKGFMGASLRTIAANAGMTTGAMYRHFKNKDDFFCTLVDGSIEVVKNAIMQENDALKSNINPISKEHEEEETKIFTMLLDYIYSNFDTFTLLLTKAAGSTHENFLEEMCDLYTKRCVETFNMMYEKKYIEHRVDAMIVHIIASSMINSFVEIILHKIPKQEATAFIKNIRDLFHFGTLHVMGISAEYSEQK